MAVQESPSKVTEGAVGRHNQDEAASQAIRVESFRWETHFETGLQVVDTHHPRRVDPISRFGERVTPQSVVDMADLDTLSGELAARGRYQFREEEPLMRTPGRDPRHMDGHASARSRFLDDGKQMYRRVAPGGDPSMARQFVALAAGQPPATALGLVSHRHRDFAATRRRRVERWSIA